MCRQWRQIANKVLPPFVFGAAQWRAHFGDVGEEPPLPPDLYKLLYSPCHILNIGSSCPPIFKTHLFTLIPTHVNGKPFCLDALRELIQHPKKGSAMDYRDYGHVKPEDKTRSPDKPYWVLVTRRGLDTGRYMTYKQQESMIDSDWTIKVQGYKISSLLAMTASVIAESARSDHWLYSSPRCPRIRCREINTIGHHCIFGNFDLSGVSFGNDQDDNSSDAFLSLALCREFHSGDLAVAPGILHWPFQA
jgi:hypothetical protein